MPHYPTPWFTFFNDKAECFIRAENDETVCGPLEPDIAHLITELVNREVDPGMVPFFEANEAIQELAGQLAEALAQIAQLNARSSGGHA
jgi:hypothetical protein